MMAALLVLPATAKASVLAQCTEALIALEPDRLRQANEVRKQCISDLGGAPLEPEIAFLRVAVYDSDSQIAETAASMLALLAYFRPDSRDSLAEFAEFMRTRMRHTSFTKRHRAFDFLENIGWQWGARDIQPLFLLLAENPGIENGFALTKALALAAGSAPEGIPFLLEKWRTSEVPLRYQILDAFRLSGSSDPRVIEAHIAGLQDSHPSVQQVAVESLWQLGDRAEPALQALGSFAQRTEDEYMRRKAQQAINRIRSGE
jgi:HEAT repeat protein